MSVPYATASSARAREQIIKILRGFGCQSVGFMDDYEKHEVLLAFHHRGRAVQLRASAAGWAQLYLKENPYSSRRKMTEREYRNEALRQGQEAVNSILRDWIKGQITAVECGILSFEAVFMPHMLLPDGRSVLSYMNENNLLPNEKKTAPAVPGAG